MLTIKRGICWPLKAAAPVPPNDAETAATLPPIMACDRGIKMAAMHDPNSPAATRRLGLVAADAPKSRS
jgi:hypothetical protein